MFVHSSSHQGGDVNFNEREFLKGICASADATIDLLNWSRQESMLLGVIPGKERTISSKYSWYLFHFAPAIRYFNNQGIVLEGGDLFINVVRIG